MGAGGSTLKKATKRTPITDPDFVAQQVKLNSKEKHVFAATPPLEAQKLLFAMAVTEGVGFKQGDREHGRKLAFIDV